AIVPDKSHPSYLQHRLRLHADIVEAIADSDARAIAELADRHRRTTALDAAPATRRAKTRRPSIR
ncbi:MAG: hypothetical protein JWM22_3491, partial [Frankiales bacterium]|nr:hypothetical protein [Frankiales bacterium]